MKILVINAGSSSLKFQLFNGETEDVLIRGHFDGIGTIVSSTSRKMIQVGSKTLKQKCPVTTHEGAIDDMLTCMVEHGVIDRTSDISAIGHRVVHGGERYTVVTRISDTVLDGLKSISYLAPLHNPANISCIEILAKRLPEISQYAVFDTAFHQTMPREIYLYGLPIELYTKFGIRKYGFHGTSHRYVSRKAAELANRPYSGVKIITCHLGNGQSICAVLNGRSFDTSMGFTPLEGLPMGTRSGSFDPEIVLFLQEHGYSPKQIKNLINRKSGLLGISGISSDHRVIESHAKEGDENALLANDMLIKRITGIIGYYCAEMEGVDIIAFTGGIGEHSAPLRGSVLSHFGFLGLIVDQKKNYDHATIITRPESPVTAMVIPTNEELQICRETMDAMVQDSDN